MRLLIDANLSPVVGAVLRAAGHDAVHVVDIDLLTADDQRILDAAGRDNRIIVSADSDFGALLAAENRGGPSFVLLRSADHLSPLDQAALLMQSLERVEQELLDGAIVSLSRGRIRLRTLPVAGRPDT